MSVLDILNKLKTEREPMATGPIEYIICGLGNPGVQYENTRHNTGFMAIDTIAKSLHADVKKLKFKSLTCDVNINGKRVLLMKPQTFMNASGEAVREAADFYKIAPENITVICDDVNFGCGVMRIRRKGSDGGQKGVRDIIYQLSSDNFPRIKLGVGEKPNREYPMADWVLGKLGADDREKMFGTFEGVYESVLLILDGKIDDAMCKYSK